MSKSQLFWKKHLKAWAHSGLSQKNYCHSHGLNAGTFSAYKAKFKNNERFDANEDKISALTNPFISLSAKESTTFSIKLANDFLLTFDELPDPIWMGKLLEVIRADSV